MAQRKISAYWLILVMVVVMATMVLTVGVSYARYVNIVQWNTLVNTQQSDERMLVLDGSQIIDLGRLPLGSTQVQFILNAEPSETVTLGQTEGIGAQLQIREGICTLTMDVETYPETATTTQIPVLAGEQILGTFQVTLPGTAQLAENSGETQENGDAPEETAEYLQASPLFLTEEYLQITLGLSDRADLVEITLDAGFPAGTRYSVDGGTTWYLLYFGGAIRPQVQTELNILVDVADAAQIPVGTCILKAESYSGQTLINTLYGDVVHETATLTSPELMTAAEDTLTVSMPQSLGEYEFKCSIEILTTDAVGNLIYSDATASFEMASDVTNIITVRFAQQLPQAGTYRLNLTWSRGQTLVHQSLIPFFISYSDANTGGAE